MPAFRSFAGGEIAPALYARTDLAKYQTSMRTMRNFVAQRHGGTAMRAGTEMVAYTKNNGVARLIPFVVSDAATDSYVIELGENYLRFHQNGAALRTGPVGTWHNGESFGIGNVVAYAGGHFFCKSTHVGSVGTEPGRGGAWQTYWVLLEDDIIELYTPYSLADLEDIVYSQSEATMCFTHPSHPQQELRRLSKGPPDQWSFSPIVFGSRFNEPQSVSVTGGAAGNTKYWGVTAVDEITGEEGLPGIVGSVSHTPSSTVPADLSWLAVAGANKYNVYRSDDNVTYGLIGVASNGAPANNTTDSAWTTPGDRVTTSTEAIWMSSVTQARNPLSVSVALDRATDGRYTVHGSVYIQGNTDPTTTQGRVRAFYSRDGETRVDAGIILTTDILQGVGQVGPVDFSAVISVPDNGYTALTIDLVPEVIGFSVNGGSEYICDVTGNSITWNKASIHFFDYATAPDYTQAPPKDLGYFQTENDYPSCVTHYQQRRVYGNSVNNPGRIWASRIGNPNNFLQQRPLTANAPVVFDLDGHKTINVRHLLDVARLVAFNSGQEKVIEGETQSGIIKPDAINARSYSYNGTGKLPPIAIGELALYVQARGNQVRMLKYGSEASSADLTVMASHLLRGHRLVSWDYATTPDSVIWAVRSDGVLLGMTFLPEQDVWGWHRHDTQGTFESVCVVPEGLEDRAYVIVKRDINGETKRFVERMATQVVKDVTDIRDAVYMDCSKLLYDGRNTDPDNYFIVTALPSEMLVAEGVGNPLDTESLQNIYTESGVIAPPVRVVAQTATFAAGNVGDTLLLISDIGKRIHVVITEYVSATEVTGYAEEPVPDGMYGVPLADWARTVNAVGGIAHLVGENVSILADGYVLSSPNNPEYPTVFVGSDGVLTFDNRFSVIRAGLPFVADLETLDLDIVPATVKAKKQTVSRIIIFFENSAGLYVGQPDQPTAENLTLNLQALKIRDNEAYTDPTALMTDSYDVVPLMEHQTNGRVFLRQLDPLPTTVLMIAPSFAGE